MELCLEAKWGPGKRVKIRCWEQEGLDLEGMRIESHAEKRTEGEKEETDGKDTITDD